MKNIFYWGITFVMATSSFYAQKDHPGNLIKQQKAAGVTFQEVNLFTETSIQKSGVTVPEKLSEYSLLSLNTTQLKSMESSTPDAMNLTIPGKLPMTLELVKVQITTDDFEIIEMPSGKRITSKNNAAHYRGIVKGNPSSLVAISLLEGEVSGVVSIDGDNGNRVLGKLDNSNEHIFYKDADIADQNSFSCGYDGEMDFEYTKQQLEFQISDKAPVKCPRIFFDINRNIVNDKGGVTQASNHIQALFNQVAVVYANEDVTIRLSGINAWTSAAPYDSASKDNRLGEYRKYRNNNSFNGDLAHLVTYIHSGGVAYITGLCSSYNQGISTILKNFQNVPTYSWSVYVIAHELGHNFGSNHTHRCVWNGNNTAIDGCWQPQGNCSRPGIPSGGGTIMSYCHLQNTGVNFNKGFGPQPGNVIRSFIANSGCTQTCDGGGGGGITNGGTYLIRTKNNKCLDVYQRSTANGANIHQWDCYNGTNQRWTFNARGGGYYEIKSVNSGKCLDVAGYSTDDAGNIHQWSCHGGTNQQFRITSVGGGKYLITARNSNRCLDVAGGNAANGTNIQQWGCWNQNVNQQFTFQGTSAGTIGGTIENFEPDELLVFPSPTSRELNLKIPESFFTENAGIKIYSITGKLVLTHNTGEDFTSFNVEQLAPGSYFMKIVSGDQQMISRFQKK